MTVRPPLIDADTLATELGGERPPTILDVRWDLANGPRPDQYAEAHIATAAFVDLDQALAAPPGDGRRGRHPLPEPREFSRHMRAAGVEAARPVVVYDDAGGTVAARAWWLLLHHGHPDVRVLDGGLTAWIQAGHPTQSGDPERTSRPGDFDGAPGHLPTLDADGAARLAAHPNGVLLDARPAERFRGETEPVDPRAGHIPGARSRPTADNLGSDKRFADPDELGAAFAAQGITSGHPRVGAYCGSGVTAAHEILALRRIGVDAALYPGSWSEWSRDPDRPAAAGPD